MKYSTHLPLTLLLTLVFAFIPPGHSLVGKWGIPGTPEFVTFSSDQTYEVSLPDGKVGERGSYKIEQSTFFIKNAKPVCGNGYWGKYKIDFYGEDSVHFTLIEDSCTSRRMDIVGYNPGLKRYKAK
ncbi:MAG: hypothetical protein JST42_03645 [Bacteroidetes bacterium]|nr:hypothetical protein [Bacteroidota bacterium]